MTPKRTFVALWAGSGIFLLYWMVRLWGHFPAFMDTVEYVFPEKWFNVECFRQGRLPLWNPYIACGTPHLAALQPAVLYPFFWLWNLTGLTDWFFILGLVHQAWAAVGFHLWLRTLKATPLVASFCALGFAGSALMTFYWGFPTHLASVAWVPWIFWASQRSSQERSWRYAALLALFMTFQVLAGYPFFTFYAFLLLAVFVGVGQGRDRENWVRQSAACFLALGLTSAQWVPFLDLTRFLHREGWGDYLYNLNWKNYLTLFQPHLLGIPGTAAYRGDYPDFIFNNLYLGIVPLIALVALFFSPKSRDRFWKGATVFWFLWLPGIHFLLWRLLPGTWMDRLEPAKAAFLFVFCAFTALGVGLTNEFELSSKRSWIRKAAWGLGALWLLDILLVPFRVVPIVPDPYRDEVVRRTAAQARQWTGEGRLVSLREQGKLDEAGSEGLAGSVRRAAEDLVPNSNVVWGIRSARGYLTIYTDGFQNLDRYLTHGYPYDGRLLDAAGVGLILSPWRFPSFKYSLAQPLGGVIATRNAGSMGNVWKAGRVRELPGRVEVLRALLDPNTFLEEEILTEKSASGGAVVLPPASRELDTPGPSLGERLRSMLSAWFPRPTTIALERPSPCEARFEVTGDRAGFLVFNESFSPGWHAWVNGKPKPIFRADGLFMAVPLGIGGTQQVLFRYEPLSLRLGLFLSLMVLMFFGVVLFFGSRARVRKLAAR